MKAGIFVLILSLSGIAWAQSTDGSVCTVDADCKSGYCRANLDSSSRFCVSDSTSCVDNSSGTVIEFISGSKECALSLGYKQCLDGIWITDSTCDDGNPCTDDACIPGEKTECIHSNNSYSTVCYTDLDGNPLGGTPGTGRCSFGTKTCSGGEFGRCLEAIGAAPEVDPVCDYFDNDCDGLTDESFPRVDESCNYIDDDCDGSTDENWPRVGSVCSDGIGGCQVVGKYLCNESGHGFYCDATAGEPQTEICNGIDDNCNGYTDEETNGIAEVCNGRDDDCDGLIDEEYPKVGFLCSAGIGACQVLGEFVCSQDGLGAVCNASAGSPVTESCNGLDDDCDGYTDEDFPSLGSSCSEGIEVCQEFGAYACSQDGSGVFCDVTPVEHGVETCNGMDDDCDGLIDEDVCHEYPVPENSALAVLLVLIAPALAYISLRRH